MSKRHTVLEGFVVLDVNLKEAEQEIEPGRVLQLTAVSAMEERRVERDGRN